MLRSKLVDIAYADVLAFVQSYCLRMFDPTRCYSREFDESLFLLLKLGVIGIGFLLLRFSPRCPSKIRSSGHSENLLPGGCAGSKAISWLACLSVLIVMSGASSLLVLLRRFRKRRIRCQGRSRKNLIVDVEPKPRRQRVTWICGLKHWPLRIVSSVAGLGSAKIIVLPAIESKPEHDVGVIKFFVVLHCFALYFVSKRREVWYQQPSPFIRKVRKVRKPIYFTFRNSGSRSAMSSIMAWYCLKDSRHRGRIFFGELKLLDVRFLCKEMTSRNADLFHFPLFSSEIYETGKTI